jgi:hypothetical protein
MVSLFNGCAPGQIGHAHLYRCKLAALARASSLHHNFKSLARILRGSHKSNCCCRWMVAMCRCKCRQKVRLKFIHTNFMQNNFHLMQYTKGDQRRWVQPHPSLIGNKRQPMFWFNTAVRVMLSNAFNTPNWARRLLSGTADKMWKQMQAMANVPHLRSILHTWNVLILSLSSSWLQKNIK